MRHLGTRLVVTTIALLLVLGEISQVTHRSPNLGTTFSSLSSHTRLLHVLVGVQ